jgi:hypothetical protein
MKNIRKASVERKRRQALKGTGRVTGQGDLQKEHQEGILSQEDALVVTAQKWRN